MSEKRFTEEEARRIFARVAERQMRVREGEPGLTLEEMQEAARASGLDPALVAAVAAEVTSGDDEEAPSFGGVPLTIRQTRVIPVEVDEEGWARIVTELRRAFGTPGVPTDLGRIREWTSTAVGHGVPVHVTLTPGEGAATIMMEQTIASHSHGIHWVLPAGVVPTAILAALVQITSDVGPGIWWLPVFVGGLMALILGVLWLTWRRWSRTTERRFERAMDRVELAARSGPSSSRREAAPAYEGGRQDEEAPRLSLGDLPEAESTEASRTRGRARS